METIEIIVYLFLAVVIGGLMIAFIAGLSPSEIYSSMKGIFFTEKHLTYEKIDSRDFASSAYDVWKKCGFGIKNVNRTVYVESGGPINLSTLFSTYIKLNLCYTIQSANMSCGKREDVIIEGEEIIPPAVITIMCDSKNKTLKIRS